MFTDWPPAHWNSAAVGEISQAKNLASWQMIKSLELGQQWSLAGYFLSCLYSLPKLQLIASQEHAYGIFQQILWLILFIRAQKMSIFLLDQNEF